MKVRMMIDYFLKRSIKTNPNRPYFCSIIRTNCNQMKRIFLSTSLFVIFGMYALYQNIMGAEIKYIVENPEKSVNSLDLKSNSIPPEDVTRDSSSANLIPTSSPAPSPNLKPSPKPASTPVPISAPAPIVDSGLYRNGQYSGDVADAYYGNVQVKAVISGGKITDVQFLDYPQDRQNSIRINTYAIPLLTSEAISAQSANVDTVSGASFTSGAFRESLSSALAQAQN